MVLVAAVEWTGHLDSNLGFPVAVADEIVSFSPVVEVIVKAPKIWIRPRA